jgi:hypothetical protein
VRGLQALANHHRYWLREIENWAPTRASVWQGFGSLARYLLATHDVPDFMTAVWFEEPSREARDHQKLFVHLARGHRIRGFHLPIRLTRRMADYFLQAPADFTVQQALRWCQVRGWGGDAKLATIVARTHLGTNFGQEAYWRQVLQFVIDRLRFDRRLIAPLLEFLRQHPEFSLATASSRSASNVCESLLGQGRKCMGRGENWPYSAKPQRLRSWSPTRIEGLSYVEPDRDQRPGRLWTIRELTDSRQLIEEGRQMRHCAARYADACARRISSIWSMRRHGAREDRRILTIEVDHKRRQIVQARGKFNRPPTRQARAVMELWAQTNGLAIASSL